MHKTFDEKKKQKPIVGRKKIYYYRNKSIDKNISENNTNTMPTIKTKKLIFDMPEKIKAFNNTIKLKKQMNNNISSLKHCNSITTNNSIGEKALKKVTFSTVEIIRVENYKKYNASCSFSKELIKKNMEEMKQDENEVCSIF